MRLIDYLDKGVSLGVDAPCLTMSDGLTMGEHSRSYGEVQRLSWRIARALDKSGVGPGDKVAILSANDPVAFSCVFGISRAGAVWCPVNPRSVAAENRELLDLFDCVCLIFQAGFAELVAEIAPQLPKLTTLICLDPDADTGVAGAQGFEDWLAGVDDQPWQAETVDDVAMIVGTGGTTGRPKGVQLTGHNLETMTAITLIGYPFTGRPRYLALAPLTHAAGVLCFPVLTLGGEIVILPRPDLGVFLATIAAKSITHTMLPPTLIYQLLDHPAIKDFDLSSLQCLWYGAAPMSPTRLEQAIEVIGPVLGQFFGQTEAPMVVSTMAPSDHLRADGTPARERFASAGRPAPLVQVAIMAEDGAVAGPGERGEIVVRGPLVMAGYYKNPAATAEASAYGWHHTGDIGYLDADNFLFIVDRAKDMIISGGFNVYSAEVESALLAHPAVRDCAVVGLPDERWGERVTAVVELQAGGRAEPEELRSFAREHLGGIKAPKQLEIWPGLPRSTLGKVLKREVRDRLLSG